MKGVFRTFLNVRLGSRALYLAALLLPSASMSTAQITHGTTIVIGSSKDKVVVAADSRSLTKWHGTTSAPNDHVCKIATLGNQIVFAGAGIAADMPTAGKRESWNAYAEAKDDFINIHESDQSTNVLISKLANRWLSAMRPRYEGILKNRLPTVRTITNDTLFNAAFIGIENDGEFQGRQVSIRIDSKAARSGVYATLVDVTSWEFPTANTFKVIGHYEIALEFAAQSSPRAAQEALRWQLELNGRPNEDWDALTAAHYVQLTEQYAPPDWGVGGPIDLLKIVPGKGIIWINKKPGC